MQEYGVCRARAGDGARTGAHRRRVANRDEFVAPVPEFPLDMIDPAFMSYITRSHDNQFSFHKRMVDRILSFLKIASTRHARLSWAGLSWARLSWSVICPGRVICLGLLCAPLTFGPAQSQSLREALENAYRANPELESARARLRSVEENLVQAGAGRWPQVSASGDLGYTYTNTSPGSSQSGGTARLGITVRQSVYDGQRTASSQKRARAMISAEAERLRATGQRILLSAAQNYFNVVRNASILELRTSNIEFLDEQVRGAEQRMTVGEGTRTDLAQTEARRANALATLNSAQAQLNASQAAFFQVIGLDATALHIGNSATLGKELPASLDMALEWANEEHPELRAAFFEEQSVDIAINIAEADHSPQVTVEGNLQRQFRPNGSSQTNYRDSANFIGRVSMQLYDGGRTSSRIRQAKENLESARLSREAVAASVRANVVSAWGRREAAISSIAAAQSAVSASELALAGVIEERNVGQRATLDVLNAQLELLNSRVALENARYEQFLSSYTLLSAVGRLSVDQ